MILPPVLLSPPHVTAGFDCGCDVLNRWLTESAIRSAKQRTATTYVIAEGVQVIGYYCLAAHSIVRLDTGGGWLSRNTPDPIPAVLLGRLAVDKSSQGRGLGWSLLRHAINTTSDAGTKVGIRALVVDPIDSAAEEFYARYGFRPFPGNPTRMFTPLP